MRRWPDHADRDDRDVLRRHGVDRSLLDAARDADVFIAEAYFFDKKIKWHLDYATLAANLSRVTARRTIATHMSADVLSRLNELEVMAASDGLVLDL